MYCANCGKQVVEGASFCSNCGAATNPNQANADLKQKSKIAAGLFGIFLGAFGVHRFYLGFVGIGIVQIVVTIVTLGFGGVWGFIEGILLLTGTFNKDARGIPLRD
ncbi:TM2 domain-containing membrane protein YozV [Dehalogenimonas formicexedens]|uniref:TM2 domain-containing membrane protein YozV n=1 Tax=Dehalogenimonas formicexedens TaxID=1839801 RepID=A0A1P8F982_9CHLR|nr:TM2 domain-containing protein [Dehalogenimonas formicexedens]APV45008.1 TM2 domain-containing membrane protein YozV [Dehalogenimonas formicexedens]